MEFSLHYLAVSPMSGLAQKDTEGIRGADRLVR